MMKEGTSTMDANALAEKLAAMGGEINIGVGMDQLNLNATVLSEFAPAALQVMADLIMNPLFPESEFERIKNDRKRSLSIQLTRPQNIAAAEFFGALYKDHAYGRYFPTEELIDGFTIDEVKDFYKTNFGARRTVIYVSGRFITDHVRETIQQAFTPWNAGPDVNYPQATAISTKETVILDRSSAPQTTIIMGLPTITPKHPDYLALSVTNTLLGGSFGSRITQNIREDKGYTYSPYSTIQNRKSTSVWYEQADVTAQHTGASINEIAKEIERLQNELPLEEEVIGIRNYVAGSFVRQNSNRYGIVNQLNFIDQHGLPEAYLENYVQNVHATITAEKLQQMAKKYIRYEDMTFVLVGDKKLLEKQIELDIRKIGVK
jgi:predicted Zn-dependent peptidase